MSGKIKKRKVDLLCLQEAAALLCFESLFMATTKKSHQYVAWHDNDLHYAGHVLEPARNKSTFSRVQV